MKNEEEISSSSNKMADAPHVDIKAVLANDELDAELCKKMSVLLTVLQEAENTLNQQGEIIAKLFGTEGAKRNAAEIHIETETSFDKRCERVEVGYYELFRAALQGPFSTPSAVASYHKLRDSINTLLYEKMEGLLQALFQAEKMIATNEQLIVELAHEVAKDNELIGTVVSCSFT